VGVSSLGIRILPALAEVNNWVIIGLLFYDLISDRYDFHDFGEKGWVRCLLYENVGFSTIRF
jgi:hypothetical protein